MYDQPKDLIDALQATSAILAGLLRGVIQEQAMAVRGGDEGWSVVGVLCHLRDAEERAQGRLLAMRDQDDSSLAGYDIVSMSPKCVALLARRCRCRCRGRRDGGRLQRADDEILARRLHDLLGDDAQLVGLQDALDLGEEALDQPEVAAGDARHGRHRLASVKSSGERARRPDIRTEGLRLPDGMGPRPPVGGTCPPVQPTRGQQGHMHDQQGLCRANAISDHPDQHRQYGVEDVSEHRD